MPFTRRRRGRSTFRRKRTFKRRGRSTRGRRRKSFIRTMPVAGYPLKKLVKMRFVGGISLNPGAGALVHADIEANDAFNPDAQAAQPLGWDEYTVWYDSYRVISSRIVITPTSIQAANNLPGSYTVALQTAGAPGFFANLLQLRESNLKHSKIWSTGGTLTRGTVAHSVSMTYSAKRTFQNARSSELIGGTDGTPAIALPATFVLYYGSNDVANDPGAQHFTWEVTYLIQFLDRKIVTRS